MTIQKIKAGRVNGIDADNFVGDIGQLFYNEGIGDLRVSDGVTAGGIPLSFGGGGGGGNYILPTATTTVKGGVKIDGSTITIANQVIGIGTVPYNKISGTPTIPTDNSQLANSSGYITSSALTGLATQSYVTSRGYLTSVSWDDVSSKPALFNGAYASLTGKPTLFSGSYTDLTNQPTLFSGSYTDLTSKPTLVTSYTQLTDKPTLFSGSYTDLTNKPTIPTDINQLTDVSGLLGQGGGTGTYTLPTATDTVLGGVKIGSNISINAGVISVAAPFSGSYTDLTSKPTLVTSYTQLTDKPTIPSITGLATETYVTTQGYITSSALTGLATETYVTTRGYLTAVDYSIITNKPALFSGSYTDLSNKPTIPAAQIQSDWSQTTNTALDYIKNKPTLFSGSYTDLSNLPTLVTSYNSLTDLPDLTGYATLTGEETLTSKTLTSPTITDGVFQDTFTIGNQIFYEHGYNGFSVNEDFDIVGENNFTGYHYTSGANRDGVAFTLARTGQFTTGFGIHGTASDNEYVIGSETTNTDFVFKNNIGMPFNVSGGTEIFRISKTGVLTVTQGETTETIATETYVTTQGYITSSALTGLATESFVTTKGYLTAVDYGIITNTPAPYTWSIAADDSTLREILTSESIKFLGTGGITTASDAEGNITITGSVPDRLTSNNRSAVLNSNGTFSLPTLTAAPATPQAGQMALADGISWDPIAQNNGAPYMIMYTGTAWIGLGSGSGGVTVNQVYDMILEMG